MLQFKVGKTEVTISFWFVAMLTLLLLIDRGGYGIVTIVTVLLHELSHILMFFIVGQIPKKVAFEPTGIKITKPVSQMDYCDEFLVQMAGIATNFTVFIMMLPWVMRNGGDVNTFNVFCFMNLAVGIFNALPIKMLDGGKIVMLTLQRFMSVNKATVVCNVLNAVMIVTVLICGIWFLLLQ